ncbi:MAG: class I SAM-dependent DNA methyltransferase [Candidatus Dormibacter sp.]|uniref:class I SAM-dependent DNA methyltransferase n=1 Tax=Candidatus Dormibacter sp. TaxID=2973982 RepID=UPI000DB0C7CE|nr:MAG: class I SAM-dependent methyltransferase [Candidatus Dormibacteraeota bacterium]
MPSEDAVRKSYDAAASEYAAHIYDELRHKPLDRRLLDELVQEVNCRGTVCDIGCGPGHVARYLREGGVEVTGIDLSPRLIEAARRLNPGIRFEVGDMRSLEVPDAAFAAVVAFYSLIHFDTEQLRQAVRELRRILRPDGVLLASFHRGSERRHVEDLWGVDVNLDFHFFEPDQINTMLTEEGLPVERITVRPPYIGFEVETERFYVSARRPAEND